MVMRRDVRTLVSLEESPRLSLSAYILIIQGLEILRRHIKMSAKNCAFAHRDEM